MGYITTFNIQVQPVAAFDAVTEAINAIADYEVLEESCKWYEHEEHCIAVSKQIPALIILDGDGEDTGDVWRKAFANGRKVWEWRFDNKRPSVPQDIVDEAMRTVTVGYAKDAAAKARKAAEAARVAAEEAEATAREAEARAGVLP